MVRLFRLERVLHTAWFAWAATVAAISTEAAPSRVLVVNSDASVAKYSEVQTAFREAMSDRPIREIDLSKAGEAQLRRLIVAEPPAVIYCIGASAYQSAARIARDHPIVFSSALNWERLRPGKHTRVIANELPAIQQLTFFRHFFPQIQRVGVVYNRDINRHWFERAVAAGREVGIEVVGRTVTRATQVPTTLRQLASQVDALWLAPDPVVLENEPAVERYFAAANAGRKAVLTYSAAYLEFGATLVLAPDTPTIGRQAAGLVQDFRDAQAVSSPAGSEVILDLRRLEETGLELNREALDSVNHLIR
jgi:putative tryptophan/tyrosine transport system substrate-binding protein